MEQFYGAILWRVAVCTGHYSGLWQRIGDLYCMIVICSYSVWYLLSTRSLQASLRYCNDCERHFVYFFGKLDVFEWYLAEEWVLGKSDPVKFLARLLQGPREGAKNEGILVMNHFCFTGVIKSWQKYVNHCHTNCFFSKILNSSLKSLLFP